MRERSSLQVAMQDVDEPKGREAELLIAVSYLDVPAGVIELNDMDDYRRIYVPDEIARFLLDGSFSLDSRGHFYFRPKFDNPYPVAAGIADDLAKALEKGCKMSPQLQLSLCRYSVEIRPNRDVVVLSVD